MYSSYFEMHMIYFKPKEISVFPSTCKGTVFASIFPPLGWDWAVGIATNQGNCALSGWDGCKFEGLCANKF